MSKCTCPAGFYDCSCVVHRHNADREQLERDLRRIPKQYRQQLIDDESRWWIDGMVEESIRHDEKRGGNEDGSY